MSGLSGWRSLGALAAGLLSLALAAMVLGSRVMSDRQAAARAAAPAAPVLTAPVEQRSLTQEVVARGQVTPEREVAVDLRAPEGRDPVVSGLPVRAGREVVAGIPLAEVSGRPVIVLRGAVPAYRDLRTGSTGPDVRQLEVALAHAGYPVGRPDQVFDDRTGRAVRGLWRAAGYEPVTELGDGSVVETAAAVDDSPATARPAGSGTVTVPRNEVVFVPELPLRVGDVAARVGRPPPEEAALRLHGGSLRVTGEITAAERELVERGMPVAVHADGIGETATGVVGDVGAERIDTDSQVAARRLTVVPDARLAASWLGLEVRLVIELDASPGRTLVVPLSALRTTSGGGEQVVTVDGGEQRSVPVTAGLAADGYVGVTPDDAGSLSQGDQVVVGR